MTPQARGLALVAASALIWSSGGLIVRLLDSADNWTIIFWRSVSACLFLALFLAARDGRQAVGLFRRMGLPGMVVGAGFACASICFVVALSLTTVAETLMIMSSAPLMAALLGRIVIGEVIRPLTWATIAAVMGGIALMVSGSQGEGSLLGSGFALLSTLGYSAAVVTTRRHPQIRMTPAVCTGAAMAALVALPFASPAAVTMHDAPLLLLFGAGQLGLGMAVFVTGARLIPAAHSALTGMLETILGPLWVWLALAEQPGPLVLVGGAIVITSVLANTLVSLHHGRTPEVRSAGP
ncbi:MAG: DMT family transporter [Alphaproteobacteria bacterium]